MTKIDTIRADLSGTHVGKIVVNLKMQRGFRLGCRIGVLLIRAGAAIFPAHVGVEIQQ